MKNPLKQQPDPELWTLVGRLEALNNNIMSGDYDRVLTIAALKKIAADLEGLK